MLTFQAATVGSMSFTGEQFTDTATLGPLTVTDQAIVVANSTTGFPKGVDGILGYDPPSACVFGILGYGYGQLGHVTGEDVGENEVRLGRGA